MQGTVKTGHGAGQVGTPSMGVRVTQADHGQQALEMLRSAPKPLPWSVGLMDLQMPVMDGDQATQRLRQQTRLKNLPIISLTARVHQALPATPLTEPGAVADTDLALLQSVCQSMVALLKASNMEAGFLLRDMLRQGIALLKRHIEDYDYQAALLDLVHVADAAKINLD